MYSLLELCVGILMTEWTFIFAARRFFKQYINEWYSRFGGLAVLSDVSSIFIGIAIATYLYSGRSLLTLMAVAVAVQWTHDFLFYGGVVLNVPEGTNDIIDLLRPYGADAGIAAVIGDSWMIVGSLAGAHVASMLSVRMQLFLVAVSLYMLPYAIHHKK